MNEIVLAAYCVIENDGQILLVKGMNEGEVLRKWSLPGGKIEEGELVTENVYREVKEEVGLELNLTGFIYTHEYKDLVGPGRTRFFFTGSIRGKVKLQEGEIAEAKWLSLVEARKLREEDFHLPPYFEALRRYLAGEVYPKEIFQTIKK